jgi:hypothetical protein
MKASIGFAALFVGIAGRSAFLNVQKSALRFSLGSVNSAPLANGNSQMTTAQIPNKRITTEV